MNGTTPLSTFDANNPNQQVVSPTKVSIDFNYGYVYADPTLEGVNLTFTYQGSGISTISANRIWTLQSGGTITQTLADITSAASQFNYVGIYNGAIQYKAYNIVNYLGTSYMCISASTGNFPTNQTYFKKIAGNNYQGVYSSGTTYNNGDSVVNATSDVIYVSVIDGNIGQSLINTAKWTPTISVASTTVAESSRVTAESGRVTAETGRTSTEITRASNETTRGTNETNRSTAEATRAGNETTRQSQETTRQTNETARISNNVSFSYKNTYNAATAYVVNNQVSYNGTTYICILNSTNNLPTNVTYWSVFAAAGAVGSVNSANGDITVVNPTSAPVLTLNSGTSANQIPKRDTNGNILNIGYQVTALSANTTLTPAQSGVINVTTAATPLTITLPTAATSQLVYTIKKVDSGIGTVTIATTSSQLIDGVSTKTITNQYATITIASDGSNWFIDVDNSYDKIGILSALTTINKTSLVNAVNENVTNLTAHLAGTASWKIVKPSTTSVTDIQAAIDSLPTNGGVVYLDDGDHILRGIGTELIKITKPIKLIGNGYKSKLIIDSTVPNTTDIIRIVPVGGGVLTSDLYIGNFCIWTGDTNNHGQYAIHLDLTDATAHISRMMIERLNIYKGSFLDGIKLTNPTGTDAFYCSTIQDCLIDNGINLERSGDSNNILRNQITGYRPGIVMTTVTGAAMTIIEGNNITAQGGAIRVISANQVKICNNQIEQVLTYNSDKDTNVYLKDCEECEIVGNNINAHALVSNCILIEGNSFNNRIDDNLLNVPILRHIEIATSTVVGTVIGKNGRFLDVNSIEKEFPIVQNLGSKTVGVPVPITLSAGATDFDTANFWVASIKKKTTGEAVLYGYINVTTITSGTQIATIPVGYRPVSRSRYIPATAFTTTGAVSCVLAVAPTGELTIQNTPSGTLRIVLDSLGWTLE